MTSPAKAELRAAYLSRRNAIPQQQREKWSAELCRRIEGLPVFKRAESLFLFCPTGSEVSLLPLVHTARERGLPVAFPRCLNETDMQFFLCPDLSRMKKGRMGILEPPEDSVLVLPDENTLCLLPGLAFDREGFRLGYGKGYYDRYLARHSLMTLAPVFPDCLCPDPLPREAFDLPADRILLPDGTTYPHSF